MEKKYKLTDETINLNGVTLYRIEALKDFGEIKKGDKGGFVESEKNLSQEGNCWIYNNSCVYDYGCVSGDACILGNSMVNDSARVYGAARVCEKSCVSDEAHVCDNTIVLGDVIVFGDVHVTGNACVRGDAEILADDDYIVFKNWWSSGSYFTWTRSNNMWSVGCFYGTGEELIKKAYKDSELSGREYERIVKYVEEIRKDNGK